MSKGFILESFVLNPCISSKTKLTQSFERIERDQKCNANIEAGLRVYAQLLTKAWKKRCNEVRELNDTFRILKDACQRAQENLEWKNSCYFEQQYVNEDLTCQLCMQQRDIELDDKANEELMTILNNLESKKKELLMQISEKSDKCISSNLQISELKVKAMQIENKNSILEEELRNEIEKAKELEEKNIKTAEKICEYQAAVAQREEVLLKEIEKLNSEIQSTKIERKLLKTEVLDLTKITAEMKNSEPKNSDVSTNFEKRLLSQQVASLRKSLEKTFEHKLFKNIFVILAVLIKALEIISPVCPRRIVDESSGAIAYGTEEIGYVMANF